MHLFEENIKNLGLNIPELPKALANYVPYKIVGKTMYISGQAPVQNGWPIAPITKASMTL